MFFSETEDGFRLPGGGGNFYARKVKAFSLCGKVSSTGCNELTLKKGSFKLIILQWIQSWEIDSKYPAPRQKSFPFNMLEFASNHKETVSQTSQIACSETFFPTWIDIMCTTSYSIHGFTTVHQAQRLEIERQKLNGSMKFLRM